MLVLAEEDELQGFRRVAAVNRESRACGLGLFIFLGVGLAHETLESFSKIAHPDELYRQIPGQLNVGAR